MKNKLICAAGLSLLLAGCGGGGGALSAAGGSVNQAQALKIFSNANITQALGTLVPTNNAQAPISLPAGFMAGMFDSCTTKNPTSPEDLDNDGIPALLEVKYSCNNIAGDGGLATRVGTYKIVDFKDEAGNQNIGWGGGFRYDLDFSNGYAASHEEFKDIYKGYFEVKNTSSSLSYNSEYTGTVVGKSFTPAFDWNWKWQSQWENTYMPDDMAQPYAKGSAKFNGFFAVSGAMQPDTSGKQTVVKVVFALKSKDLKYDRSCSTYWKEGSIIYVDGSNNEIRYDYSCANYKAFFNGTEITQKFVP